MPTPRPQRLPHADPAAVADRARSRGWKADKHVENDKLRDLNKFDDKVKEKQDRVLNKYAIWHWDKAGRSTDFERYKGLLLQKGTPMPPIHELKDFWRFYKDQSVGRLRAHPTSLTLKARAKEFKGGYMRMTGSLLNDEDTKEINRWIKYVLPREQDSGVKDIMMPKYNYKPVDLDRHLDGLYTRRGLGITHERTRFQFHLMILMFANSGARKGGLLTDGIKYKDIHLVLNKNDKGNRQFIFGLDQRTVKNNKDPENNKFGVTGREHKVLRYNAVFLLLLLAIADDALDREYFVRILKGTGDGPIEWNKAALNIPICRSVDRQGVVHNTKPMTESVFLGIFKKLFMAEYGYSRASMHMIRREIGKQLDERYTEVERSQHLTQADKTVFGQSYVAFVSSCDGFAAFRRETPDHTAVEYFQGVSQFWQPGLPTKLPAALKDRINKHPDILELKKTAKEPDISISEERCAQKSLNILKRRLERTALEEYRTKCFKEKRRERLLHGNRHGVSDDDADPLNDLIPEKGRIAKAMICTSAVEYTKHPDLMRDALLLLTSSGSVYYRPQEAPKNGCCPYCPLEMDSLPVRKRSQHIHRCRRQSTAETLGVRQTDLKFCFFCMVFYTKDDWQDECQNHLSRLKYCCSTTYRHTLLRPAFCALCKQSEEISPEERLQYWHRDADAIRHIDEVHGWYWLCAECNFSSDSKQSGLYHLHDAHGYNIPNTTSVRPEITDAEVDSTAHPSALDFNVQPCNGILESREESSLYWASSSRSPESSDFTNYPEVYLTTSSTMLDSPLPALGDSNSDPCVETLPGNFYESSAGDTASFWDESPDFEPLDELMSKYIEFQPDTTQGGTGKLLPAEPSKACEVVDVTKNHKDFSVSLVDLTDDQHRSKGVCPSTYSDSSTWLDTSLLQPLTADKALEQEFPSPNTAYSVDELAMSQLEHEESKDVTRTTSLIGSGLNSQLTLSEMQLDNRDHKQSVRIKLKLSSSSSHKVNKDELADLSTPLPTPERQDPPPKRTTIKLWQDKKRHLHEVGETGPKQPKRKRQKTNVYEVKRYLAIWGKVFLEWDDGTTSWEPKSNILDKDGLAKFQAEYQGIDEGVDILDIRGPRARGYQFLVHWHGRPDIEDRWVDEKYMKQERIEEMVEITRANSMASGQKRVRRGQ